MRRLIALATALAALAVPASASAHNYWADLHFSGSPWSSTRVDTNGIYQAPTCGNSLTFSSGEHFFINGNGGGAHWGDFGFTRWISGHGIHGDIVGDDTFTSETRQLTFLGGSAVLGTRRVYILTGFGFLPGLKVVYQSGNSVVTVRADC